MFYPKIFIFTKLNYSLLPIALFQKILGQKVYFIELPKNYHNKKSINFLKLLGLNWLNFQDYHIKETASIGKEAMMLQKDLGSCIDKINIANYFKDMLCEKGCNKNDLKSFALSNMGVFCREFCTVIKFIDYLKKNEKSKFIIIGQFPPILKKVFNNKIKGKAKFFNIISFAIFYGIFKKIFMKILLLITKFFKKKIISNNNEKVNLKKYKTIYFPHQGIYYGNIYKKDHFYSKEINSNFHFSNILHISTDSITTSLGKDYYKKNNVTEINFNSLGKISLKEIIFDSLKIIPRFYFFSKDSFRTIIFFIGLWFSIKNSLIRLNSLPNAQSAIFGYDLLSPRDIAIACEIKKIKTVSTQERFLSVWESDSFFILDHYLTINKKAEEQISAEHFGSIKKMKSIGPIRGDLIINNLDTHKNMRDSMVLVLDSHSHTNYYKNGLRKFANWHDNYLFYMDILRLSEENKNIKFIIKGKYYDFMDLSYFSKIKKLINESSNVEIFKISEQDNSAYTLMPKTGLIISRHTSAVDEILFKKLPLILYDSMGYPSTFFNYGKSLVVKNYDQLEEKFNLWKKDSNGFKKNILEETKKYLHPYNVDDKVYDFLHDYLKKEFKYYS